MKKILKNICIIGLFLLWGCTKTIYVPVQAETRIEYKDSLIYMKDTIYMTLPTEEKEIKTTQDSSHLETSIAVSDAWIDEENNLNHTLKNKSDTVYKYIHDTVVVTKIVKEYKEVPVIEEVEKPVKYVPSIYKISMIICIILFGWVAIKLFLRFR